jgi:radical SAM superfamily enzyme YgiQ (UPF0313 family)
MGTDRDLVRLVAVNPERFSLGLAYLEAALTARFGSSLRVEQSLFDLAQVNHRELDLAALAARIVADEPVVVGLSWYCWNHRLVQDLARLVRALAPDCQLVVGGPETGTIVDEELAAFPVGTLFVLGEGEGVLPEIVAAILDGDELRDLPAGTARRELSGVVRAPRAAAALPAFEIASPILTGAMRDASTDWLPSYATTRGCVFKCSFCAWQDGFREREFDLDVVLRELALLSERGYDRIWITDTIFGRNEPRTMEILRQLQEWPTKTRFAVELHAKYLSARLADELARVPLAWAAVGIQSLARGVLKLTRRSPHTDELLAAVSRLYRALTDRSVIHLDIIFGLPLQTVEDCFETVDVLLENFPEATIFTGMLQVIPGTEFERLRNEPGWVILPPEADGEVVATPTIDAAGMQRIRDLSAGLDAYVVRRSRPDQYGAAVTAAELEVMGRALRDSAFAAHPVYGRRERFGPDVLAALLPAGGAVHA